MSLEKKYLKYKNKYLKLKKQVGSGFTDYDYGRNQKYDCNKNLKGVSDIKEICSTDDKGFFNNKDDCTFSNYCLEKWKLDNNTYCTTYSKVLICDNCKQQITSEKHNSLCNTVSMYEIQSYFITLDFNPLMTFGLCGCTAMLMVFFDKIDNQCYKVVLGHHPEKDEIIKWYSRYYNNEYNIVTIIKSPGNYVNDNGHWIIKTKDEQYYKDNITNCKIIFEPYSEMDLINNPFIGTLYFRINPNPNYTNNEGKAINITYS